MRYVSSFLAFGTAERRLLHFNESLPSRSTEEDDRLREQPRVRENRESVTQSLDNQQQVEHVEKECVERAQQQIEALQNRLKNILFTLNKPPVIHRAALEVALKDVQQKLNNVRRKTPDATLAA